MAAEEHDREDLMREATAFVYRAETNIDGQTVFVGIRAAGQLSVYWGSDPVWQFDLKGRLRRAFWRSQRITAVAGRLAWVQSVHLGGQMRLPRKATSDDEQRILVGKATEHLARLREILMNGPTVWSSALPKVEVTHEKLVDALAAIHLPVQIADDGGLGG